MELTDQQPKAMTVKQLKAVLADADDEMLLLTLNPSGVYHPIEEVLLGFAWDRDSIGRSYGFVQAGNYGALPERTEFVGAVLIW